MTQISMRRQYTAERQRGVDYATPVFPDYDGFPSVTQTAMGGDLAVLIEQVAALREEVAALRTERGGLHAAAAAPEADSFLAEDRALRVELGQMVRAIATAKEQIAQIKHPLAEEDRVTRASSELDATVAAAERATHDILAAAEEIESYARRVFQMVADDEEVGQLTDKIGQQVVTILEACNFQDITGQRVTKVIKTLRFIEDRILAMIGIWGPDAFADLPVPHVAEAGEESLLNGPALEAEGISQDEIDALFD